MTKVGWGQRLIEVQERLAPRRKVEFSYEIGSNRTSWPKFEREEVAPDFSILIRLRERGVDLNWLATGDGSMFGESPFSASQWADVMNAVTAAVRSEMTPEQKARSIVGYLRGLLDAPEKPDNIPTSVAVEEAANDGGTLRKGGEAGPARDASRK